MNLQSNQIRLIAFDLDGTMQNAVDEVKAAAGLITGSCEESGVAEVIEQILQ